ncbi:hypothetical protein [Parerythrobacter lacustris]|uniref:DUF4440 domain-containing protein n=1 Tax=Parerythrobacter lacustris TaxID=2969984 RepID=A0ABT1XLQ5_9SPHN|nr:hypothetical protein [Parerythrobacter lacustris]MCR2832596.1 hypothetical protein [Parerythrobacter lacustris]
MFRVAVSLVSVALLASCASGPPRIPRAVIDRALVGAPGEAQPGKIVAAEIAFSQAARDEGQWTAFRKFMAPGAVIHGVNGPIDAAAWLATQKDPLAAVQWAASSVWMSCDGRLAVSRGRFRDPEGLVGTFVTVWQRQDDGAYRWIYDAGAADDPQPGAQEVDDGAGIIVSADDIIQGYVADCPSPGSPLPLGPFWVMADTARYASEVSPDKTLRWSWEHEADGTRRVALDYLSEGKWERVPVQTFAPRTSE